MQVTSTEKTTMNAHIMTMTAHASAGDNSANARAEFDKALVKLGAESVNLARPKLAIAIVTAASLGALDEKDVEAKYDMYLAARERAQAKNLLASGVDDGNGKKANVSKCVQLCKLGNLPDIHGPSLLDRTVTLRGNMVGGDERVEAPFEAFVKVARAQLAKPDTELTDDELAACIRKPEPKDKDELQKLVAAYKAAYKLAETIPMQATEDAVKAYADAITAFDGEIPAMTKEEKEMAAFMKKAREMGMNFAGGATAAE
jgi:hypothetical protein